MDYWILDEHAPKAIRKFHVPEAAIRRNDLVAFVYDVGVSDTGLLRHYSLYDRAFVVNASLHLDGRFMVEEGSIPWSLNCDICTKPLLQGNTVRYKDLWLDVLVGPDGFTHQVIDRDDFDWARGAGYLSTSEERLAEAGLAQLLEIITSQGLVSFLDEICPWETVRGGARPQPMVRLPWGSAEKTNSEG